jgi:hypothetical protein
MRFYSSDTDFSVGTGHIKEWVTISGPALKANHELYAFFGLFVTIWHGTE